MFALLVVGDDADECFHVDFSIWSGTSRVHFPRRDANVDPGLFDAAGDDGPGSDDRTTAQAQLLEDPGAGAHEDFVAQHDLA